jgi:hypothetical protein
MSRANQQRKARRRRGRGRTSKTPSRNLSDGPSDLAGRGLTCLSETMSEEPIELPVAENVTSDPLEQTLQPN